MKRGSITEILAAIGVIVSLIFVGIEIRQNTAAARGATFQAISEGAAQSAFDVAANDHLPRLFAKLRDSDPPLSEFWNAGKPAFSSDFVSHFETLYPVLSEN